MSANTECLSKRGAWWLQSAANARAQKILQQGGPKLRAYQCTHCRRWHLTSKPDRFAGES